MKEFFSNPRTPGFIRGLVLSFYNFIDFAKLPDDERPDFNLIYWFTLGLLYVHVYLLGNMEVSGLIALQVGLTSPLILKGLISNSTDSNNEFKSPFEA